MKAFPDSFSPGVRILNGNIGLRGDEALERLREKGFNVGVGLTEYHAGRISEMSHQPHIVEYCPRDRTLGRFATLSSTSKWLQKGGGRAMFVLLRDIAADGKQRDFQLEGYGWTGYERCDELPGHPVTSAYRIGNRATGQGLAKDFVQTVVSGTRHNFSDDGIGLETWASNPAASLYPKVGFVIVRYAEHYEYRPTLDEEAENGVVADERIYMGYPDELLV
jgi:hypothetical protein